MKTSVRGADRALMIFEAFEKLRGPASLREIAEICDLPVSSCHALVQTLLQRGYLYTVGRRKELYPNARIFRLAQGIVDHDPFLARFAKLFEALRDQCRETVTVAKQHGDTFRYLYTLDSLRPIGYTAKPGDARPLHATATGKALLGTFSDEELSKWLASNPLTAITSKTVTSRSRLLRDLEKGRKLGYFAASGEYAEDLDAIAVPVFLISDVIAVSVAGPTHRIGRSTENFAEQLLTLKSKLESELGDQQHKAKKPARNIGNQTTARV